MCNQLRQIFVLIFLLLCASSVLAQQEHELNTGWKFKRVTEVKMNGLELSNPKLPLSGWLPATVPGTVLTSLLNNHQIADPFWGMNNKSIPDIYSVGKDYYTCWFVNDFYEPYPIDNVDVCLYLRGVNYSYDIYLNGHKINDQRDAGMFLRSSYNITPFLDKTGYNRLAIIVYPPDPVGNPNGGQGGDGVIAHSVTNQYVAGWDWIQPVHDRNTGIWDKVFIKKTGKVHVENTHVVTLLPGKRNPSAKQQMAKVTISTELENSSDSTIEGIVEYFTDDKTDHIQVKILPHTVEEVVFPELEWRSPLLWWPNGYGEQHLYNLKVQFKTKAKTVTDAEELKFGIRQLTTAWNNKTQSREIKVNGQKIFIKGGNWILSDAMLRFTAARYDAEVRYHRDMNLNLIRVWGGGITERPEFYEACDKYGLLVMQDFWASGDCNGRWFDPLKLEDTNVRRNYPDDHRLFIESLEDQIKLLRNHPSLALWCGGNEIRPSADILSALKDTLLPELDGTRYFFEFSNDDSMSLHGGDGPYVIQKNSYFWEHRSFPFNSEIGSVGVGDYASLQRFIPDSNLVPPYYDTAIRKWVVDSVWSYHKYSGYDSSVEVYGHPTTAEDFTRKAQLVNYNQYRALMEGASSRIWDWYTGIIIWKTQNPWTAIVGQMYDYYLDPNACLFGTKVGAKPIHCMYNETKKAVTVINNLFQSLPGVEVKAIAYTFDGTEIPLLSKCINLPVSSGLTVGVVGKTIDSLVNHQGAFLYLCMYDTLKKQLIDENFYWLPDNKGNYSGLQKIDTVLLNIEINESKEGGVDVLLSNSGKTISFFNRLSIIDAITKKRVLPAFYSDNYCSILPSATKSLHIDFTPVNGQQLMLQLEGWNTPTRFIEFKER